MRAGLPELYPRLWRFALSLTGERAGADDLAQATAARALEQAAKYQAGTSLSAWLFTMARRIWLNEKRAERIRGTGTLVPIEQIDLPAQNPDVETNRMAREVLTRVMALPEAQRATVLLVYVEGHTYKEAAAVLEIPIGTVMSRLAAARQKLQTAPDQRKAGTK
ncbi:RNA polymerase sigma factor [Roseibium sp.]|uniref:RNA polymerase sigma factor n=1 Tax=Roseibium sp. TaxID=1936156 RepID=UPI003BAE54FA